MLNAQDVRGLYAILPTPAKPGADALLARRTVDLDETARTAQALIQDGCQGLIALGTTGECPTLAQDDFEDFVGCLLDTVKRRVPTFIGTSALGGHEVARRMRFITDAGADGTLLGLPMWQPLDTRPAVDFYRELSIAFPQTAIMVYANQRAFRFAFPDAFWEGVVREAPTVVAAKVSRPANLRGLLDITRDRINIVPNEMILDHFYAESPETTTCCWATAASMGPKPAIALMDAVTRRDGAAVQRIAAVLAWANEPITQLVKDPEVFALYNIQMEKVRIATAGYCAPGPVRSPYKPMPDAFVHQAQECGRRWARLNQAMAQGTRAEDLLSLVA